MLRSLQPLHIGRFTIDVPIVLAPMAGVSESPFRVLALEMGAGLAPTELVSAKGLEYASSRTEAYLRSNRALERPFTVQLFGGEPRSMAAAAEIAVSRGAEIIDINMGCPVKKVTRSGAGSALMCDPARAQAVVLAIKERVGDSTPVTAKIRAGWDERSINAPDVARALEDAGASLLAIHARTRAQGYAGRSDWDLIARVVKAVRMPVIANGDIKTPADADEVVARTGCRGVMIGRAALGNPWIFRALKARWSGADDVAGPSPDDRARTVLEHLGRHLEHVGDPTRAIRKFRQHLIWYSRGLRGGSAFRERATRVETIEQTQEAIQGFFLQAMPHEIEEAPIYDERVAYG